ncbi:hypothetical protein A9Q99_13865 [Gammaproteobacteria bacterium 45_16_T64]|nr:hypothetical protein A9Q99_13865 [Gammaproteobacteria bacterium 45_16_T64]
MSDFFAEFVNIPVTIEGRCVILMPDLVGIVPLSEQHLYVELQEAVNQTPAIHVNEADIENIRETYPDVPIYGLWQTLINSGLVSYRKSLQVVQSSPMDGFYIHCDLGRAEFSGDYEAGFFAADASFTLDDAAVIAPDLGNLSLPENQAQMAEELQAKRKKKARAAWISSVSVAACVVLLATATDFSLLQYHRYENQEILDKSAMRDYLLAGLDGLKTSRITDVPNDHEKITKIAEVWAYEKQLTTQGAQEFKQNDFTFIFPDRGADPSSHVGWFNTEYSLKNSGEWVVNVTVGAL